MRYRRETHRQIERETKGRENKAEEREMRYAKEESERRNERR